MLFTFISGFLFFIALVCLGTTLIIHCRGFYHLLAQPLKIISESGLTKEVVLRNYDHLIEYCSPFYRGSLSFPDFPSSPSALSHFAETKTLFSYLSLGVPVCFFAGVLLIALKVWGRGKRCLKNRLQIPANLPAEFSRTLHFTARLCVIVPFACLLLFLFDFHSAFYRMHHILFDNNDWIFDAATDPIITILPERYFLCCGMGIILFLLLAAAVLSHLQNHLSKPAPCAARQKNVFSVHS